MTDERAAAVAVRAAELASARRVELPDDLALWRLAGGRPVAQPRDGRPEELGELLEAETEPDRRQRDGAHYTPEALALEVVARALAGHERPSVCDPACGGGALLLAAARWQASQGDDPVAVLDRLWGIDLDPVAAATTEAALAIWAGTPPAAGRVVVGDALSDEVAVPQVDVVVGNPPFLSQLGVGTARDRNRSAVLRGRFGEAVQAYTDPAGLFLLVGCSLVRDGGTVAMVQPQSFLAARDAGRVRAALDRRARLREVWLPSGRPFRAAVDVCVPVLTVGRRGEPGLAAPSGSWGAHLARAQGVPPARLPAGACVGDEATTAAAFRAEYYGIVPHVHEAADLPAGRALLTTGLVEVGRSAWGERPSRIGGRRWERPVVDVPALDGRAAAWAERTAGPKLVVATQTRVIEVVVDDVGAFLPGVPLIVVLGATERLWLLAAALSSPPVTAWAAEQVAGTALAAGALRLTAGLVRAAPLPPDDDAWREGAEALEAGALDRFADVMTAAYACDPAVASWWLERVGSAWSAMAASR